MKSIQIKVEGLTYTVKSTTEEGLKRAVRSLKRSLKKNREDNV